jgi:hypothetical protein
MKSTAGLFLLLLSGSVWGQGPASVAATPDSLAALRAEIERLRPADHVWRAIPWKTCPLEALKEARTRNQPVIAWVFLGIPTDERC